MPPWRFFDPLSLVTVVILGIICAICTFVPYVNPLFVPSGDSNSSFPHKDSTIPTLWLNIVVFGCNCVVIVLLFILKRRFPKQLQQFRLFTAIWGLIAVVLTTTVITELSKVYVGRARPDAYDVCGDNVNFHECRDKLPNKIEDEYKSWPSGHSSIAMSGLAYLTFFGIEVMRSTVMWIPVLWTGFIMLAIYIGSTRIRDFRHHPDDVLVGLFIGFVWSVVMWSKLKKRIFVKCEAEMGEETTSQEEP